MLWYQIQKCDNLGVQDSALVKVKRKDILLKPGFWENGQKPSLKIPFGVKLCLLYYQFKMCKSVTTKRPKLFVQLSLNTWQGILFIILKQTALDRLRCWFPEKRLLQTGLSQNLIRKTQLIWGNPQIWGNPKLYAEKKLYYIFLKSSQFFFQTQKDDGIVSIIWSRSNYGQTEPIWLNEKQQDLF